jgi:hypothetical protein
MPINEISKPEKQDTLDHTGLSYHGGGGGGYGGGSSSKSRSC